MRLCNAGWLWLSLNMLTLHLPGMFSRRLTESKSWPRKYLDVLLIQKGLYYSGSVEVGILSQEYHMLVW